MTLRMFMNSSSMQFYQSKVLRYLLVDTHQSRTKRMIFPLIMGLLFSWGFQPGNHVIIAFAALIAFYRHFETKMRFSQEGSFWAGYWFGFGFFFGGLHWIAYALHVDWVRYAVLVPLAAGAIPGILALGLGSCTWISARVMFYNRLAGILSFILVWSLLEWIKGHMLTGFPWLNVAEIWLSGDVMIQNLACVGPYALGLLTLVLFVLLYGVMFFDPPQRRLFFVAFVVLGTGLLVNGYQHLNSEPQRVDERFELVVVQPNILQIHKWEDAYLRANVETLVRLSLQSRIRPQSSVTAKPKLFLWPEASVPYLVDSGGDFARYITQILEPGDYLILGAPRQDALGKQHYNAMVALDHQGIVVGTYDKAHLVPFGEYVPYREFLPSFVEMLAPGDFEYAKGPGLETVTVGTFPPFSPLICYEAIFTQEVLSLNQKRPQWMLNLTNDGWYLDSSGIYQHLYLTRMRAIEEGMPLVRVVYRGISAVFDAHGRMTAQIPFDHAEGLVTQLPKPLEKRTFYSLHGNSPYVFLLFFCFVFMLSLVLYSLKRTREIG